MVLVFILLFSNILNGPLNFLINGCLSGVEWLAQRPFVWAGAMSG